MITEKEPTQGESTLDKSKRHDRIIECFKSDFGDDKEFWDPIYKECKKRKKFTMLGKQLDDGEKTRFNLKTPWEPNLLINYVNYESNKTLQVDYLGKVTPNGYGATEISSRARQDVLRGLDRKGNISQVFNFARRDQVVCGLAYSIASIEWGGKRGFGKDIVEEYLEDTFNVFPDRNAKNATLSDATRWTIEKKIHKSEWKKETGQDWPYGNAKTKILWYHYVKEVDEDTEYLKENGTDAVLKSEREPIAEGVDDDLEGLSLDPQGQPLARPVEDFTWKWYKITEDHKIIDEEIWEGAVSPITACLGRKVVEGDKVYYQSLTQFAETPAKMFTILANIIGLRIGRSPFSRFKIAFESVDPKGFADFRQAALVGDLDLLYNSWKDGKQIPAPEEIQPYVIDPVLISLQQEQVKLIERIFGTSDASFGRKSNESSGIAQEKRKEYGDTANYDSQFNYLEYVEQVERKRLDLIPKYMTAPQQIQFVDPEDKVTIGWINTNGGIQFNPDEEHSLVIQASPIADTARAEEAEFMARAAERSPLVANNPKAMAEVFAAQPGKGAQKIATILREGDPQLKQAQGMIQELQGQLKQTTEQAKAKMAGDAIKIQTLQASLTMCKQMMGMLKAQQAMEKAAKPESVENPLIGQMQATIENQELQLEEFKAEAKAATDKQNADSKTFDVETNRLKVAGELARPEPVKAFPV